MPTGRPCDLRPTLRPRTSICPGRLSRWNVTKRPGSNVSLTNGVEISALVLGGPKGTQTLFISNSAATFTTDSNLAVNARGVLFLYGNVINPSNGTVAGVFNWMSGTLNSNVFGGFLTVAASGTLNLLGDSNKTLYGTLASFGKINWTNGGNFNLGGASTSATVFSNLPGAVFDIWNDRNMPFVSGTNPPAAAGFYNYGLLGKSGGVTNNATYFQVPCFNGGTFLLLTGNTVFADGLTLSSSNVLQFPIAGTIPGAQFGTLAVAQAVPASNAPPLLPTIGAPGSLKLAGTLNICPTNGYAPNDGDTLQLMSFALKESAFDAAVLVSPTNGMVPQIQIPTIPNRLLLVFRTTNTPPVLGQTNMPDQTVAVGSMVTFSPPASGVVPFTYQWTLNGTNLPGQTNASLTISNVQSSDAGSYCVGVMDALSQSNNWCASLSVFAPPALLAQPASQTVSTGSVVTLSVNVSSPLPVQYQWRRNGENIPGANVSTYAVTTNAWPTDSGQLMSGVQPGGNHQHDRRGDNG